MKRKFLLLLYYGFHEILHTDVPMNVQGFTTPRKVIIGNDVWIGARCKHW